MGEKMSLEQAMRRAFSLGQTYGAQADSESWSQNKKADETRERFNELLSETLDAHPTQPAQAVDVDAVRAVIEQTREYYERTDDRRTAYALENVLSDIYETLTAALPNANGKEG